MLTTRESLLVPTTLPMMKMTTTTMKKKMKKKKLMQKEDVGTPILSLGNSLLMMLRGIETAEKEEVIVWLQPPHCHRER